MNLLNDYDDTELEDEFEFMDNEVEEIEGVKYFFIEYECEDCNYRWKIRQSASLSDENRVGLDRWEVDETNIHCPMCGGSNIVRA